MDSYQPSAASLQQENLGWKLKQAAGSWQRDASRIK